MSAALSHRMSANKAAIASFEVSPSSPLVSSSKILVIWATCSSNFSILFSFFGDSVVIRV